MTSLLSRIATLIRVWLGLPGPDDTPMTPAHGWLLPVAGELRGVQLARVVVPVTRGSAR
jgi:hypothetical protein